MLKKRLLPLLILIALPLMIQQRAIAQESDPCDLDLSQLVAALVEAQAVIATDQPELALPVVRAAAEALTIYADRCEASLAGAEATPEPAPEVTPEATRAMETISGPGTFVSPNGVFTFRYPQEWLINDFIAIASSAGQVTIGSTQEAIDALNSQLPALASGHQGIQVFGGAPEILTGGEITDGTIENMIAYFVGTFERQYPEIGAPEFMEFNGHPAASLTFGAPTFDSVIYVLSMDDNQRFVILGGVSAKGELDALIPIIAEIAASVE